MKRSELKPFFRRWPRWLLLLIAVFSTPVIVGVYTAQAFGRIVEQAIEELVDLARMED